MSWYTGADVYTLDGQTLVSMDAAEKEMERLEEVIRAMRSVENCDHIMPVTKTKMIGEFDYSESVGLIHFDDAMICPKCGRDRRSV